MFVDIHIPPWSQNPQILIKCDILGTGVGLESQCLVACTTNYKFK